MYCYDGLYYQLISPCLIFLVGTIWLFWVTRKTEEDSGEGEKKRVVLHIISALAIVVILFSIVKVGYSIINPTITTYTGQFDTYYRDSRSAPPLPFTYHYRFKDGEKAQGYSIDQFSIKKIYPDEFEYGKWYTIYSVEGVSSQVIVRIEEAESPH